ncbi:DUF1801 domain-containing protein [Octadecabacter sp. 1_MG-2023]|uniref:DUF1801 domain-containing protein n=1 Tax=unclassified Octadecabacter TaxID=196158 RepID=UPI001C091239|nr:MULTISPECIES: DUF1801 domain-containing protein [unclassified Octadecabacter]MBU2994447.1 DUF1801 domain-containing protein [Octadecabacter sp. B2R22]MDO6734262.1 DUF1801 domain-containing protein [Octadecabacter sp. 1_MG-2023]
MAGSKNKTQATSTDVDAFIQGVEHPTRRADALALDELFQKITGWSPRMWGPTIIGYGQYHYIYDSGREGDMCATGFSPRKSNLSLYIMPGYQDFGDLLARLGKHKTGAACLYINKLADVDLAVLEEIIRAGLSDLDKKWPVRPS